MLMYLLGTAALACSFIKWNISAMAHVKGSGHGVCAPVNEPARDASAHYQPKSPCQAAGAKA